MPETTDSNSKLSSKAAAIGQMLRRMNLDFRRPLDEYDLWVETISAWARTLDEVPESRLMDAYEGALASLVGHAKPDQLPTALQVLAAWLRIRNTERAEREHRTGPGVPALLRNLEFRVCERCRRSGYTPPTYSGEFLCPRCRATAERKANG